MITPKRRLQSEGGLRENGTPYDIIHRFEKIPTRVYSTEAEAVKNIADHIVNAINDFAQSPVDDFSMEEKTFSLGLTTGRSPIGLYRELVARYEAGEVSFRRVSVYSLDEFYPMSPEQPQSRNYRIHEEFINKIDIRPENVKLITGDLEEDELIEYCNEYDDAASEMDLVVIGVGEQGQIGFNEAGSNVNSRTRLVQLSHQSRVAQSAAFGNEVVNTPHMAITLGMGTVLDVKRVVLMAWGEDKAEVVRDVVEGEMTTNVPASLLQGHENITVYADEDAASMLTRWSTPWLVGSCDWTPRFVRKAVTWLCAKVDKPILKLTYKDYVKNSLSELLEKCGPYDKVNIEVFNAVQHTITGWPGGKPNADDSTRPVKSLPFPKRVVIFSPHPDDDVVGMGGTLHRLITQGSEVHVAYQTSGAVAVNDDVLLQNVDTALELGFEDKYELTKSIIASKVKGEPEPKELLEMKAAIRRAEARAACRSLGLNDRTNAHFLNMPFYETGSVNKELLTEADVQLIVDLLSEIRPHQIYVAGDFTDPHDTHRRCYDAVFRALEKTKDEEWNRECNVWLYRSLGQDWNLGMVDMAVPLSPGELLAKRYAIYRHLSQKDLNSSYKRDYWQSAEEKTRNNARLYDKLGMAEYEALEIFVRVQ
ncbi:MAG: PIG-L family deacetylase [Tidjanibacter sp.]|nr:PIG-L family deacetylase [Tidjanibacter sp.]MBQ2248010.1 PIG-L family deacetylase [Tidjanibacter sp.]